MIPSKPMTTKLALFILSFFVFSIVSVSAQDGKALFNSKCASCHQIFKDATGPKLGGVTESEFYGGDMTKIYNWIRNVNALLKSDAHFKGLQDQYKSIMTQFPESDLSNKDIDAIFAYINTTFDAGPGGVKKDDNTGDNSGGTSNSNAIIFGVISLILAIIALILMQVNSNLKKMSDDAEGIRRPEQVPFYKNKVYIAMLSLLFFVIGGYYVTKGAIGLGRQKDYQPEQPIYYSHKVHAGINQISCLYCHGSAWDSKHASIPAVNICMNCHKSINEYVKGPKLYTEDGDEINGTAEIAKLYKAAGFDPAKPNDWDATKAKPIEWVKIHNLPDHVYFNHSQHIRAGKVQCQSCHGEITAMDEVKQVSELSMGWCINCHRQSKIDFNYDSTKGNKFYSIYEKFHNDIKNHKMDSVTVKDIGGLECQKCHY
jgi:Cytochrome c/Cytochrome c7 and related cytochrome c